MRGLSRIYIMVGLVLIVAISPCLFAEEVNAPKEESKYIKAVREFADNVLKHGRDTYGPKHTPLFVDGLNVNTHEPVKWISPKGDVSTATDAEEWILSNFASQQTLLRTLDGLSKVTGDPKYRDAAMQAIKYAFENIRAPNGLFYWGHLAAYDALGDEVWGDRHTLKVHYPYYELMWQVNPDETRRFIEAYWSAHIIDWSNLDFNRSFDGLDTALETPWEHEYKGGPVFFKSRAGAYGFFHAGTSLAHAATTLYQLSGQEQPLVWSKRLIQRFVNARHPNTGISPHKYNRPQRTFVGGGMEEHFSDPRVGVFPFYPFVHPFTEVRDLYYPEDVKPHQWLSVLLMGEALGEQGKEFSQWAQEELTAWGRASYRAKDNVFMPILTDGTPIEGIVIEEGGSGIAPKGSIAKPLFAEAGHLWLYATTYKTTGDTFMWQMTRNIAQGNGLGDIGEAPGQTPALNNNTSCSDVYSLLGFLELYNKTENQEFLVMARRIADNIVAKRFHGGFFVLSKEHVYTRFDCFEPLALLHLAATVESQQELVPRVWPSSPLFVPPYRYKEKGIDRQVIYTLTESPEPPLSLQEAAAIGDIHLVELLIEQGDDVDGRDDPFFRTALHRAVIANHDDIVRLLLSKGANTEAKDTFMATPLDIAIDKGHKEIVELLIKSGADVNALGRGSSTPLDFAVRKGHKEIARLLVDKGAMLSSIHAAAQMGDQRQTKAFLDQGIDVDLKDKAGSTPLFYAVRGNHKDLVKLLIAKGADVNAKGEWNLTLLYHALLLKNVDILELLIGGGADVAFIPEKGYSVLDLAVNIGDINIARILVDHGAKFDARHQDGWTALRHAVSRGNQDMFELFVAKGADTSTFFMAACMGDLERVKNFIEKGADINTKDELGWTPLYWAASLGQTEVAKLLIDKGADVRAVATDGGIVLHQAVQSGANELVELLLLKGADVQAKTKRGDTSLHRAAGSGYREIAELLIAKGAEIEVKDMGGRTPLHRAVLRGHKDVVEILITNGADVTVKDRRGRTPLDWAKLRKHVEIIEILTEAAQRQKTSGDKSSDVSPDMAAMQVARSVTRHKVTVSRDLRIHNP